MTKNITDYEELASLLCEEFHKKQSASLLTNLEKRNLDALEVSRERLLLELRGELSGYENEEGAELSEEE